MDKNEKKDIKLEIQVDEQVACGQYVNLSIVNHNEGEFVVDCLFVQPQAPKARVTSRLIMSPKHAKRLLHVLAQNVDAYEKKFGPLTQNESAEDQDKPVH